MQAPRAPTYACLRNRYLRKSSTATWEVMQSEKIALMEIAAAFKIYTTSSTWNIQLLQHVTVPVDAEE
ncbi:hypothetical protein HKD37_09G026404 [Glycine soja]|nr:hypothetical protein glysoja_006138 [Glycine soja]